MPHYQWKVLPQGMAISPTLCQKFVDQAVAPIRQKWLSIYILHYMDDILLAAAQKDSLFHCLEDLTASLSNRGLQVAPDKCK